MSDDFLARYAENCFGKGDLLYGAFVDGKMVGAAELRSNQAIWSEQAPFGRHIHAEAAFSVDDGYRRRGIGEKLFKRILRAATNHGVETIEIVCLPENVGMQTPGEEIQDAHFTFEENCADRPPDGAPADRAFADPGSLGRRARLWRRAVRRPLAGGGERREKARSARGQRRLALRASALALVMPISDRI